MDVQVQKLENNIYSEIQKKAVNFSSLMIKLWICVCVFAAL